MRHLNSLYIIFVFVFVLISFPALVIALDFNTIVSNYVYIAIVSLALMSSLVILLLFRLFKSKQELESANEKIKKLSEQGSHILASLGEGVYGVNTDGICTFINDAALEMLGFDEDEVLHKNQHELFHYKRFNGKHYDVTRCPIAKTTKDGKTRKVNDYFITKDGSFLPVSLIATPTIHDEKITGVLVSFQDISAQKELLAELQDKEDRWHTLFENNAAGILIVDSDRNITDANIQICTLFGYEKGEIVGQKVSILHISEQHYQAWAPKFQAIRNGTGAVSHDEYPFKTKSGDTIWLTLSGVKLEFNHKSSGVAWSAIDITERKNAEEKLKLLNSNLENEIKDEVAKNREKDLMLMKQSRLAAIGEMVSNIAHQWRQPLNALAVRVQDMQLAYQFEDLNDEFVSDYKHESMKLINYMSQTIDDFRNFFKPDKQKEPFSVLHSVEDAYSLIKDNLKINSIGVSLLEYDDRYFADGYKNEFAQVILNILSNASDALMEKAKDDRSILIDITQEGEFVKIIISDNAGGIPEDIIDKIFDPYFTTKHKAQGTGLGLYMSKMIIEQNMNGKIQARNTENGACFVIEVPAV